MDTTNMPSVIYIIYNAKNSVGGKIQYAYRKVTETSSPCAACDLTHGGLRLTETPLWAATKKQIGAEVQQLHIDQLSQELVDYSKAHDLRYPVVLGRSSEGGELQTLMTREDLAGAAGDHLKFLTLLRERADERKIPLDGHPVAATNL